MSDIDWPARARLSAALDQAAIVAITDRGGRIVYCNQKFVDVSGYAQEELIGKTHRVVNGGHHPRGFFEAMFKVVGAGAVWRGTICNRNRNGQDYWVDTTIIPTMDVNGRPEFYTAIRFEVTAHIQALKDLEIAKARVEQASEARDLFYANISHEVRTPLNAMLGLASALEQTELTARQTEMLEVIRQSGLTLSRQLENMLDMSKMRSGQFSLRSAPYDLHEAVEAAIEPHRSAAGAKGLALGLTMGAGVEGRYVGDGARVGQIVETLVSNAVKFTDAGGVTVELDVEPEAGGGEQLTISVSDTGIGFDDRFAAELFVPFVQVHEAISRRFGGTGLGLPICKTLADLMGGEISTESTQGQGSCFRVRLPVRRALTEPPEVVAVEAAEGETLRVLVVEDNVPNQMVVRCLLEPLGVQIAIASDGREGVERFEAETFDVVLMDMQMPVMDGIAATQAIRALERNHHRRRTPVVMVTANTTEAHHRLAAEAGCDGLVVKPVTLQTLLDGLSSGMARSEAVLAEAV
nr:ATP-binding protein [uncultured Brevundimonas sp.]